MDACRSHSLILNFFSFCCFALAFASFVECRAKRDIVSYELGSQLSTQIHRLFIQRLMIIDQLETVVNAALANSGGTWLPSSLRLLGVLREDIKRTGVRMLADVNVCFFELNLIVHDETNSIVISHSARRSVSAANVNDMGLNFTILTLEQSQANYKASLQLIGQLDEKLHKLLSHKSSALDKCRHVLAKLKSLVAEHENRMLMTIHEAILTLNQHIQQARQSLVGQDQMTTTTKVANRRSERKRKPTLADLSPSLDAIVSSIPDVDQSSLTFRILEGAVI